MSRQTVRQSPAFVVGVAHHKGRARGPASASRRMTRVCSPGGGLAMETRRTGQRAQAVCAHGQRPATSLVGPSFVGRRRCRRRVGSQAGSAGPGQEAHPVIPRPQRPCRDGPVVALGVSVLHQCSEGRPVVLADQPRVELGGRRRPALLRALGHDTCLGTSGRRPLAGGGWHASPVGPVPSSIL